MQKSSSECGQGLVEYAFLFVCIVIVVVAALQYFGFSVLGLYQGFVPTLVATFS